MDPNRKSQLFKKIRGFAKIAGKMNSVSTEAAQKRQEEEENKNILNTAIEKGIAYEKFVNAVQRKVKTEADAKMILSNIQDYEAVNKLFGKDTEQIAKLTLCKGISLEIFTKAQPIIKQNEASNNKFYIIAKGSVAILKATDTNVFQVVLPKKEEPQDKEENDEDDDQEDADIGDVSLPKNPSGSEKKRSSTDRRQSSLGSIKRGSQLSASGHKRTSKPVVLDPKEIEKQQWIQETEKYGKEVNQLYVGQGFGEAAIMEADPKRAKRGATILAREDNTTLLIIVKRDFQKFKDSFSSQGKEKAAILSQLIPQLKLINSTQTKNDLIFYFQEEGGLRGQALTVEDKTGEKIFVLKEGQVQIEKNYINTKNIYYKDVQKLKIAAVGDYSFLGEELLLGGDDSKYSYTITVSSIQARYYSIKKSILQMKFPNIIKDILNEYELKEAHRKQTVEYILSKDSQPTNMIQVDDTLHEFNKLKNCELFSQMKNSMVESHNKKIFKDVVAKEKEQTPENLAQFRSNVMRQLEEKQEPLRQVEQLALNQDMEGNNSNYHSNSSPAFSNKQRRPVTSQAHFGGSRSPQIKLEINKNSIYTKDQLIEKIGISTNSQQSVMLPQSEKQQQMAPLMLQTPNQKGNNANNLTGDQLQQQQSQFQLSALSQLAQQPQTIQDKQAQPTGTLSSRVGSAVVPQAKQKISSTAEGNETKQGNSNIQLACDPVYSKLYQQQHDLESNFMETLTEKLKLMSKVPTIAPGEGPQLDLGYLEQFKKKQQLKLMVSAKAKLHQSGQNNNRSALVQKTVDKIKGKYAKDNSAEMENAFSDNPPLQISNQNLLAKTKHSLNTLTSSNTKTEISELSFPVSLISPMNQGGYLLKSSDKTFHFKSPYTPPLSSKNSRYAGKNPGSKLQMFSQSIAAFGVPVSPRWKTLMSQQQLSPSNQQLQYQSLQQLDPNNLQCLTVHPLAASFANMSATTLSQSTKNWSTLPNPPVSNNQGFITMYPVSPGYKQTHNSLEISDSTLNSSPNQQISRKMATTNEEMINIQDDKNCVKLPLKNLKNSIQSAQTLQTQPRSNTIQSFENFTVVSSQPRRLVSAGPLSSMLNQAKNRNISSATNNNSHNIAGTGGQIMSAGVFSTDFDTFAGNMQPRPFSSSKGQLLQPNEHRQRCQTANSLQRKSLERKKLKTGLAFPRKTPLL